MSDYYNYSFTKGNYRTYVRSVYTNFKREDDYVNSNVISFTSTQGEDVGATVLSSDIAVSHTRYNDITEDSVWFVYVTREEGYIRIKQSTNRTYTKWRRNNIPDIEADKVTLAFNSDIAGTGNKFEFITDEKPYVAYIKDNAAYIINLNDEVITPTLMVSGNVTDISLVRAPKFIQNQSVDYGFILFFLMENQLYYRQMIAGVWYDAELVDMTFESGTVFTGIEAFVTWDFRVGVLITTAAGQLLQLITYFEGLSSLINEHIELLMSADVNLVPITYWSTQCNEHIEITTSATTRLIYGHSAIITSCINVDNGEGDYGYKIQLIFDYPNTAQNVNESMFTLVDGNDINYLCTAWSLSQDGYTLTLTFDNFNLAAKADDITLTYTKPSSGGLLSPAVQTNSFMQTFVPVGLVDPGNPPEFLTAWNDPAGETIWVKMNKPITNRTFDGLNNNFGLSLQEYNYVPNGQLVNTTRTINNVSPYEGTVLDNNNTDLDDTSVTRDGSITLEVDL